MAKITSSNATENTTNGLFTLTLDNPAPAGGLLVNFNRLGSTAVLSDYALLAGTNVTNLTATSFVIKAGASSANLIVQAKADSLVESAETVKLNLAINTPSTTLSFANPVNYAMGNGSFSLVLADLNADGNSDVITANLYSNDVSVRLGNGNGTFGNTTTYVMGNGLYNLALADLNNDGKSDVVTVNFYDNTISVLLGNGNGSFATQKTYPMGNSPTGLALADLNNDGKIDVVTANLSDNKFSVRLGKGDGSFLGETSYTTVGATDDGIALADVNGDNKIDLIKTNATTHNISVFLGKGDGSFGVETTYSMGDYPSGIAVVDLNNDGKKDVITSNWFSNNISVRLGNADGSFQAEKTYAVGTNPEHQIAVTDLNNDNKLDVIVPNVEHNTVSVLLGNGDGSFQTQITYKTNGRYTTDVAVSDLNADGKIDIVSTNLNSNNISVLLNTSSSTNKQLVSKTLSIFDNSNNPPTGTVTINDTTPSVGQTLTVSNTLADADGLGTISYQWKVGGVNAGTGDSYNVTATNLGKTIAVTASYTDGLGKIELKSSAITSVVTAPANHPSVLTGTAASLTAGIQDSSYTLHKSDLLQGVTDADGDSLSVTNLSTVQGTLTNNFDDTWNFVPTSHFSGTVNLNYSVMDGKGGSLAATKHFEIQNIVPPGVNIALKPNSPSNTIEDNALGLEPQTNVPVYYLVSLNSKPAPSGIGVYQVVLNFASTDNGEGTVTSSLTFTSNNWNIPQTLTITGIDDLLNDGNVAYAITAQVDQIKTTALEYKTLMIDNINLTNTDDVYDKPLITYGEDNSTLQRVDYLQGNNGGDSLYGKDGFDELKGNLGNDKLYGENGADVLYGGDGNDALYGGNDNDILNGETGNDTLDGGIGADTMIGGAGNDTYYVDDSGDFVDDQGLATDIDQVIITHTIDYTLSPTIENASLDSTAGNSNLLGNDLNNQLAGNVGDNSINGGLGSDTLTGGIGRDTFVFNTAFDNSVDTIIDFSPTDDTLQLENSIFTKLTVTGVLNPAYFRIGTVALDANDYLIYNKTTGALVYDDNGNVAGHAVQIANVGINLALTNADFVII